MARDDRKLNGTIAVPHDPAPDAKTVGTELQYVGPDTDPDEVEALFTAEEVKRYQATDKNTGLPLEDGGVPLMEGKWAGKLKERLPMPGSKRAKATLARQEQAAAVHKAAGGHKPKE